jgi:hypothetical protein
MAEPHRESQRKGVTSFKAGAEPADLAEEMEQLVVTFNAAMGGIVKVEKVDKAGKRQELTEEECAKLAGQDEVEEIEAALEEAFEAGVAVVLGDEDEPYAEDNDDEERVLRQLLIGRLLRRHPVRRRLLFQLLLRRLLREPDLVVCLDAPAEVAFRRKGEFSIPHLEQRRAEYLSLQARFPHFAVVDADRDLDLVVGDVTRLIVDFAARRRHAVG